MRNLQLLYGRRIADCPELSECRRMAVDYDTGVVYCGTATQILGLDPVAGQVVSQADLGAEGLLAPDGSISIVGLQNIPDQMSVCAATSQGDVVLWNTTTGQIECVGSVEQGLTAMAWSPDQELLILSTGNNTLILMTRDFDPITEVAMHQTAFGEAEFINVGWGKKETQFHGAVGKQAAHVKSEAVKPAHAWDDLRPRITWRGDGQYFAVSSINPLTNGRIMHVWTREGVLHSTSESVDGMEQALSWKPSGSLIASTQRKPNKHDVMFYERNGLQHGEFTLPFGIKEVKVCEVSWNVDSSVLAVWCEELPPDGAPEDFIPKSYIQLWTVNNYHWYLKQSLSFERTRGSRVVDMCWDPSQVYRLHVICHGGQYLQYTWSWATNHSWGNTSYDLASVAVIDGDRVLMTPLRETVVPPPMSAYHLQMSSAVNHVAFAPPPESNDVAVLLQDGSLHLYRFNSSGEKTDEVSTLGACGGTGFAVKCTMPTTKQQYRFETPLLEEDYPFVIQHMSWVQATQMLLVTLNMMGCGSEVHLMTLDHTSHIITESSRHEVDGFVIAIATNPETGSVALQLQDGGVLRYDTEEGTLKKWETDNGEVITFPSPCPHIAVTSTGGEEVVIGLTERFRCYVNNCEVASNCTSFSVHEEFILLTTHSHTCRCISRHTKVTDLPMLSDGKAHPFDESIRQVERGSRIVCVVPDDSKLVLQMPRGNLETIHPRALVLTAVRKHLDRVHFKDAFMLMRKHRINMNLLHDHNPGKFLENTDLFVSQLEVVNFINLFLTDLQEEDVTETMYTGVYQSKVVTSSDKNKKCKVDTVCDAVRLSLEKTDSDKYLLSILTAHVRKSTPELEIALQRVKTVKGDSQDNRRMVTAEEALKYLLFLVDVNELYDVALGTYDFELVMMVAEKSQKDPKEYLPFLNNLRKMETNYQHYTIDKYLKRYSKALTHISKCGSDHFDECLALVTDHRLFAEALKLFQPDCQHYKDIASAYGDYLRQHSHRQEAGLMFMKAQDWVSALTTFEECLNWRQALCVATCLEYSEDKMAALCRRIAGNLKDHRRHTEAACLYEQYAQDIEEAIVTLIEGHEWEESLRLMYRYKRLDFIDTNLRPALSDAHKEQTESLQNWRSDFERYFTRLEVVRQEKEKARLEILEGGGAFNDADADLFSDTSSATGVSLQSSQGSMKSRGSSVFTKTSGRSSKNKKKAEKKKWSLKEGSPHEDVALIEALSKIIKQVEDSRGDIASLLKALVQFGYIQEAEELQQELESFLGHMEKMTADIWTDEQETTSYRPVMGPDSTANSISAALQQGRFIKSDIQIDSHLKVPPAMSKDTKWKLHVLSKSSK